MWLASSQSTSVCWERGDLSHSVWLFSKGWGQETTEKCAAKQTINRRQDLRWFSSLLSFFLSVSLRHYVGYLLCSVRYNESSLSTAEHRMGIVPVAIRQLLFWSSQKCSSERSLFFHLPTQSMTQTLRTDCDLFPRMSEAKPEQFVWDGWVLTTNRKKCKCSTTTMSQLPALSTQCGKIHQLHIHRAQLLE